MVDDDDGVDLHTCLLFSGASVWKRMRSNTQTNPNKLGLITRNHARSEQVKELFIYYMSVRACVCDNDDIIMAMIVDQRPKSMAEPSLMNARRTQRILIGKHSYGKFRSR